LYNNSKGHRGFAVPFSLISAGEHGTLSRLCGVGLLCAFLGVLAASPAAAQEPFTLSGGVGLDYQRQTYSLGVSDQEYSALAEKAYITFSSAFWSRNLLEYSLFLSGEHDTQNYDRQRSTMNGIGYGFSFHLFPNSDHQLFLAAGRNTLDWSRDSAADYTRKSDFLRLRGIVHGWSLSYNRSDSKVDGISPERRLDENGELTKMWSVGAGTLSIEARRYRVNQEFFGTESVQQTAILHTNQNFSAEHSLWMDVIYRAYRYTDTSLGLNNEFNYGNTAGRWHLRLNRVWEMQVFSTTLFSSGQNAADTEWLNRFRVSSPLSLEIRTGYFTTQRDGTRAGSPYYGAGLYYDRSWDQWETQLQGGYMVYMGDVLQGTRDDSAPYALASISRSRERDSLSLTAQYNGMKGQILTSTSVDGSPFMESQAAMTTDNYLGRLEYAVRVGYGLSLRWQSNYNWYKDEEPDGERTVRSLTHQCDAFLLHGSLGVRVADQDIHAPNDPTRYHSWDLHADYWLNTHLSLRAFYIKRNKQIQGRREYETESDAAFDYVIGKFVFRASVQNLLTESDLNRERRTALYLTLMRRFGDE
jgi:hypothetical protein